MVLLERRTAGDPYAGIPGRSSTEAFPLAYWSEPPGSSGNHDSPRCWMNRGAQTSSASVSGHNFTFAGSDQGGCHAAAIYPLIEIYKLNKVDPQAWLAKASPDCPITRRDASTTVLKLETRRRAKDRHTGRLSAYHTPI
jgi:hypothetical protein